MAKVLTEGTIGNQKVAVIVLDEEEKTAAEAIWTGDRWETDFSYWAMDFEAHEVAEALDFPAVREMGYRIIN